MASFEGLRRHGVSCLRVLSSAPLTPVSHATVLTGLQPFRHGLRHLFRERLPQGPILLAVHLQRHGLATAAIVSCHGLHRWYGFDQGFAAYDDQLPRLPGGQDPLATADVKYRGLAMKRAAGAGWIGFAAGVRRRAHAVPLRPHAVLLYRCNFCNFALDELGRASAPVDGYLAALEEEAQCILRQTGRSRIPLGSLRRRRHAFGPQRSPD